uniref:Autophagy-related protein 9 n=4 Tax=Parascaris univalens TaxID=6257 RepID=A0A915C9M6_PARUN
FSSHHNRLGYQIIDDEIDENIPPTNFEGFLTDRSLLQSRSEAEPLVHDRATMGTDLFGGPPLTHDISCDHAERSETTKSSQSDDGRWDHVENLDQFFTRVYEYHQGGGLTCICVSHILSLLQFVFVVSFSTFLLQCVDYPVLFNTKNITSDGVPIVGKRRISDAIIGECMSHLHPLVMAALIFAVLFWIFRVIRDGYHLVQFYEIHNFYGDALGISDSELSNLTWCEVVKRICQMQPRLHLIINKERLTQLDVYQRILRFKNYFVSFVNKDLLPPVLNIPFVGAMPYLSNGLKLNLEWLLFWGPWSPWEGPYALKDDYKHQHNIAKLTKEMESTIFYMGIANLVFFPLILLYQILYSFFSYAELVKREPGALGTRRYSNYGRSKIRHFNELDHELRLRLSRSHRAAEQYMDQFISPLKEIIAKNVAFVAGALFAILALLSAWDEDVLTVEHVLTAMTVCGVLIVFCRSFIADENLIWWPEFLMNRIIAQIHYAPDTWRDRAHTATVRQEFGHLFQLKAQFIVEELLSPLITPFVLVFWIRPKAREFVNFFHNFTVNIDGLGDVCSFAQMDVSRHGDPTWNLDTRHVEQPEATVSLPTTGEKVSANDGKTELSLLHFMATNPDWKPPAGSARFISEFQHRIGKDLANLRESNLEGNILLESIHAAFPLQCPTAVLTHRTRMYGEGASKFDGPTEMNTNSLITSLHQSGILNQQSSLHTPGIGEDVSADSAAAEMSLTTMCLRRLHAQHDASQTTVNYGALGSATAVISEDSNGGHSVSNIWGVPAQSVVAPRPVDQQSPMAHITETTDDGEDRPPNSFHSV